MRVRINENGAVCQSIETQYVLSKMGMSECGCVNCAVKT